MIWNKEFKFPLKLYFSEDYFEEVKKFDISYPNFYIKDGKFYTSSSAKILTNFKNDEKIITVYGDTKIIKTNKHFYRLTSKKNECR